MSALGPELAFIAITGLVVAGVVALAIVLRPWVGLCVVFAATTLIERFPFHRVATAYPQVWDNLNSTLGVPGLFLNPVEVLLGLMFVGWLLRAITHPHDDPRIHTVSLLGIAYAGWMLFSVLWGLANGGDWKVSLWILRPVMYFLTISFLTFQLIRTPRQVLTLFWIAAACVTIKSMQIILRKHTWDLELEAYGEHEDTSFALYYLWVAVSMFFLPLPKAMRRLLLVMLPILAYGILCNDRRINIATGVIGCGIILLMQGRTAIYERRAILLGGAAAAFLYLVVGWFGPETPITAPVKGFKQGIRAELMGENTDNSSWYRKVERYNLRHTIRQNPILGTGLGRPYLQLIKLDTLTFEHFIYIPHNNVLLVHSSTGSVGFIIFLTFFSTLAAQLTIYYRWLPEGWQRALALAGLLSVLNWLCVGYYDLQLFFYRNSLFVGIVVALPASLFRYEVLSGRSRHEAPPAVRA